MVDVVGGADHGLRIVLNQRGRVVSINVIRVLVGDQYGVKAFNVVPQIGERAGIDQNARPRSLHQNASMTQMCDPHTAILAEAPECGVNTTPSSAAHMPDSRRSFRPRERAGE